MEEVEESGEEFGQDVGGDGVGAEDEQDHVAAARFGVDAGVAGVGAAGGRGCR